MFTISEFMDAAGGEAKKFIFLSLLQQQWNKIHNNTKILRYKINNLQEKTVDGYLLQLNPDRGVNRRKPETIDSICQPFNEEAFNFTKASQSEIVIQLKDDNCVHCIHTILVNVSPISQYHSLLCPSMDNLLPQIATEDSLNLAMKLMFIAEDRCFRIGFNSLCALASVNHLHYHLFIEKNELPVEKAKCLQLNGPVYYMAKYPVPAFCFEAHTIDSTPELAKDVSKLLKYFLVNEIAHNIFMTKGRDLMTGNEEVVRVLVWPRKSSVGAKQLQAFNVAVCELSGWFPVYDKNAFDTLQKADLDNEIMKWRIDDFEELCNKINMLFNYFLFYFLMMTYSFNSYKLILYKNIIIIILDL